MTEDSLIYTNTVPLEIIFAKPRTLISIRDDDGSITLFGADDSEIGKFWHDNGQWHFTGNADESARAFVDAVNLILKEVR